MPRHEILEYFEGFAKKTTDGRYCGLNWEVEIRESTPRKPPFSVLFSTPVVFSGVQEIVDDQVAKFRMRFLTAGG